jgi:hypothetical protein
MKDKSYFSNAGDIRQKLNGTVIQYKGEPYYATADGENENVFLAPIDGKSEKSITTDPDDKHLDIASPPLGFTNYDEACYYVGRVPHRRSVQGLSESNMHMHDISGNFIGFKSGFFAAPRMRACILGEYPTFQSCLKRFLNANPGKELSAAFARQFALRKPKGTSNVVLHHKFMPIAEYDRASERFNLIPTYSNPVLHTLLKPYGVPLNESQY